MKKNPQNIAIGERVKHVRKAQRMTQAEFAFQIGLKQSMLSAIECGTKKISLKSAQTLARKFNINQAWLLFGEEGVINQTTLRQSEKQIIMDLLDGLSTDKIVFIRKMTQTVAEAESTEILDGEIPN